METDPDTLRVGTDVDAENLDPRIMRNTTDYRVANLLYDGLVELDSTLTPAPSLAVSWEHPDSTSWGFHLREHAHFHDGTPVTADDVVYTFATILDPATWAPARGTTNILRLLEMQDGEPEPPPEQVVADSIVTIRPAEGGWIETVAPKLGDPVQSDATLGRIVSPYSFDVLEEIRNPAGDGVMVLSHLTRNRVQPGDYGYMVATGIGR